MPKYCNFVQNLIKPFKFNSKKEERDEEDLEKIAAKEQKLFHFETLVSATKDFHSNHKLGEGRFGPVYKGKLEDGREIAVKKLLQSSNQGKKEFMNEANLLARVQHRYVVTLLGYCTHGAEKLLVYEYVANESLDKLLFGRCIQLWGLDSGANQWSKELSFQPKSRIPESTGMGNSLEVMDPALVPSAVPDQVAKCVQIGLLCTQADPHLRPTMRRVVVSLSKELGTLEEPIRPGRPGPRYRRSRRPNSSSSNAGTSGDSSSHPLGSTTYTNSATATAITSVLTNSRSITAIAP